MNNIQATELPADNPQDNTREREFAFIDLLIAFAKHKKIILGLPIAAAVLAALLSVLMPNIYKATTKILPPQQSKSTASSILSQLGGSVAAAAGIKNANELYIGMLKSRTIADNMIQRFDLKSVYKAKLMGSTRTILASNTTIVSGKDDLITIEVTDRDPKRATQIANAYVDELLKLTKVIAVTEAAQRRLFFEKQVELTKNNLEHAEAALKAALGTRGVISVDAESREMVETAARLRALITAKEIQLNAMEAFVTANNQDYKRVQQELESARSSLMKLENGSPASGVPPSQADNQSGLENIKILRDVKYQQALYELLAKQYETARLDESKDSSIVQVLDQAVEPERKFKPNRTLIVLVSALAALIVAMFIALLLESWAKAKQRTEFSEKLDLLKNLIRGKRQSRTQQ